MGGVGWQDTRAAFHGKLDDLILQDYLVGVGGGDVTPEVIERILDDLNARDAAGAPVWADLKAEKEGVA